MAWEPEDGRCRECGASLETEDEQLSGACCFCDQQAAEESQAEQEDDDDAIADFYNENGYF